MKGKKCLALLQFAPLFLSLDLERQAISTAVL